MRNHISNHHMPVARVTTSHKDVFCHTHHAHLHGRERDGGREREGERGGREREGRVGGRENNEVIMSALLK